MKKTIAVLLYTFFMITSTFNAYAGDVTVYLLRSDGTPWVGTRVSHQQGSGGITPMGITDANGMVLGTYTGANHKFSVTINSSTFTTNSYTIGASDNITVYIYTTAVIINSFNSAGNPLEAVTSRHHASSVVTLGTSDASGSISAELFPGNNRQISSSYKGTAHTQFITVAGNGQTPGETTVVNTYTSEIKFNAYSYNDDKVDNVYIRYTAGGSTTNQAGYTDANGERVLEMYPGTYTFNAAKNNTPKTWPITITGNGTSAGNTQTEDVLLTRVKFHNTGQVRYPVQGSSPYLISGDAYYMFPNDYTLIFNGNYSRTVTIFGDNFEVAAAIIILLDHNGDFTPIHGVRGGYGTNISWHVPATSVSNENPAVWIDITPYNSNTSRIYEVTKNGTISTQVKDLLVDNVFTFQTYLLTLRLQKCDLEGLNGATIRWGYSQSGTPSISRHWNNYEVSSNSTDINGNTSMEVFPGNFVLEMNYNSSQLIKNITVSGNTTVVWQTTNVTFHYKTSTSSIAYGVNSPGTWWGTPVNSKELLPGVLKFNFIDNGSNIVDIEIPEQCIPFEKTAVITRLLDGSNAPISGGIASYDEGGIWHTVANPTSANGNTVIILDGNPSTATAAMVYNGAHLQQDNVNLVDVNYVILFKYLPRTPVITNPMIRSKVRDN